MIKKGLTSIFIVLVFGVKVCAADSSPFVLDLEDWSAELKKAVSQKKFETVSQLLDLKGLEEKTFVKSDIEMGNTLEKARKLYSSGKFPEAIASYERIPRGSEVWLETVNEKGWSYFKMGQFEKALAQSRTLTDSTFLPIVGSDAFFLQSLSNLKICDYKAVLMTHRLFKESQKERVVKIQELAEKGNLPAVSGILAKVKSFPLEFQTIGAQAKVLPLNFHRDIPLQKALLRCKVAEVALPILEGVQNEPSLITIKMKLENTSKGARVAAEKRLTELARLENEVNFKTIQKLNLIEIEAIQRIHADQGVDQNKYVRGQFKETTADDLVFPDEGDPWIDELDKYQVRVNLCPQNVRRQM